MPNTYDKRWPSRLQPTPSSPSALSSSRRCHLRLPSVAHSHLLACIPATTVALSLLLLTCCGCQSSPSSATALRPPPSCRENGRMCFYNGPRFLPSRHPDVGGSRGVKRRLDGFMEDLVDTGGPTRGSSRRTVMMGSTRVKRGASRAGGKPGKPRGVGKKVRRLLEPASEAEVRGERVVNRLSLGLVLHKLYEPHVILQRQHSLRQVQLPFLHG